MLSYCYFVCSQGLHIVCAAGNYDEDACRMSPASSNRYIHKYKDYSICLYNDTYNVIIATFMHTCSIAVAASDINDRRASFSNYGPCVDLIAPVSC